MGPVVQKRKKKKEKEKFVNISQSSSKFVTVRQNFVKIRQDFSLFFLSSFSFFPFFLFYDQRAPRTAPSSSVQPKRRETNTCNDRSKRVTSSLSISLSLAKMVNHPCVMCINGLNRAGLLFQEKRRARGRNQCQGVLVR